VYLPRVYSRPSFDEIAIIVDNDRNITDCDDDRKRIADDGELDKPLKEHLLVT